jgi:hypothetical protein
VQASATQIADLESVQKFCGETSAVSGAIQAPAMNLLRGEEAITAKAILTDELTGVGIINVDEHIFVRITCKIAGKNFYEVFLRYVIGFHKSFTNLEPVGPLAAIEPGPETSAVRTLLIQQRAPLTNLGFDLFEV